MVSIAHIKAAEAILGRIAFSGGEDSDPEATLAVWRESEGIEVEALEAWARESARQTVAEIEERIANDESLTSGDIAEYLERDTLMGFQVGWITRARADARARAEAAATS